MSHHPSAKLRAILTRRYVSCLFVVIVAASLVATWLTGLGVASAHDHDSPSPALTDPDRACAKCHAEIYKRYETSAMARGSGVAANGFIPGEFEHETSGVKYRVFQRDGASWMSFHRDTGSAKPALDGERRLEYYIGSGAKGRTFLYQQEGYWFELPINYYTRAGHWEMSPNYSQSTVMPAPLPTDPNCLHCHATAISTPKPEARNAFPVAPFTQGGIGCNACHGDPSAHLAQNGHGPIANLDKLSAPKRDSVCLQCHLEGNAVVYKPGRNLAAFRPGEDLSDTALYFVYASQAIGGSRATSQYEALLQSACRRGAGNRFTCTTCHNPHGDPPAAERVQYFRARCLNCHTSQLIATRHHPEQPDCAKCHMPTRDTADISHEQLTDHNIQRLPANQVTGIFKVGEELVPVGMQNVGDREQGLAYAQLAQQGDRKAGERALALLATAEKAGASDEQLHLNLGFLRQVSGDLPAARAEYQSALAANRFEASALSNLAVLDARAGDVTGATSLLHQAIAADPARTTAGLNLAFLECRLGHVAEARTITARLRQFNPDSPDLFRFLETGAYGGQRCDAIAKPRTPPALTLQPLH